MYDLKFYNKYFDIMEGRSNPRFPENGAFLDLEHCTINKIEKDNNDRIRLNFYFYKNRSKKFTENGASTFYVLRAKYIGSFLCDNIFSIKTNQVSVSDKDATVDIKKSFWGNKKILIIESPQIGKCTIKCGKLYAESLDCYFKNSDDTWSRENE